MLCVVLLVDVALEILNVLKGVALNNTKTMVAKEAF